MPVCARSVRIGSFVIAVVLAAGAAGAKVWDVSFAVRVVGGDGKSVDVRLALPEPGPGRVLSHLEIDGRRLEVKSVVDGTDPHVLLRGKLKGARRIAIHYRLDSRESDLVPPPVVPIDVPVPELLPYLSATPLLQSRSILVREFLEIHVAPLLGAAAGTDLLRPIYEQTRKQLRRQRNGKTLTLDVIRRGGGQRIGIERAFTTFLRCARIPARLVEGINLRSSTGRKRVFWTEAWSEGRWWPASASRGWIGTLPDSYVPLAFDGAPVLDIEPPLEATYRVHAQPISRSP